MTVGLSSTSDMLQHGLLLLVYSISITALNLEYLDPIELQTRTSAKTQANAALQIISSYSPKVTVEVDPALFSDHKDVFTLKTSEGRLHVKASTGVAAVWGFNYYLKKYCKSHIGWQVKRVSIPDLLPEVDEKVVANDRFRYYQNVCTVSYSFVWWNVDQWKEHVDWMALNGINLALAPVAQEAAWARVYRHVGMTQSEIDQHFTGPAFLSWLRMGNLRGWGGPLLQSWHDRQRNIQDFTINYMYQLGIIPIFPAFAGHVPRAFERIYNGTTFYKVSEWSKFGEEYCCGLFMDPSDPLFNYIGRQFLTEVFANTSQPESHVYNADPFNEIMVESWSTSIVCETAKSIFKAIEDYDDKAVWLIQSWMLQNSPVLWPIKRVKSFFTVVPNGRMLIVDLQSEQFPQYDLYGMYFGQPFIWCMLHNFGGTLGMFGNMQSINKDVYEVRSRRNSNMIGIGLTPEGINQNYVVYELMLESAWRNKPVESLDEWLADYAERRYGCTATTAGWKYLHQSVYSFRGLNRMRGKYVITRKPSFKIKPWSWYSSLGLFEAFKQFAHISSNDCNSPGYYYDLVDVTRQALQYRAEQIYIKLQKDIFASVENFNSSVTMFLDVMTDLQQILATNDKFTIKDWLEQAKGIANAPEEKPLYEFNARNQITLWGPNGEISDYANKQWAELFHYYYIPRWKVFFQEAIESKVRNEIFNEKKAQSVVRKTVEEPFQNMTIDMLPNPGNVQELSLRLFTKWGNHSKLPDIPVIIIEDTPFTSATMASTDFSEMKMTRTMRYFEPKEVVLLHSTIPQ